MQILRFTLKNLAVNYLKIYLREYRRSIFKNESNSFALIGKLCKQREFSKAVAVIQTYICNKLCLDPIKGWKYTSKYLDIQKEEYDYVFAYGAPISFLWCLQTII